MAKGRKTGGRVKGSTNKVTIAERARTDALKVVGKDPMSFFLSILLNEEAPHQARKEAASELLPYMHPKLSSIEARVGGASHEERLDRLLGMMEDTRPRSSDADIATNTNDHAVLPLLEQQKPAPPMPTPGGVDEVPGDGRGGDGAP